jgi:hypothetical protein
VILTGKVFVSCGQRPPEERRVADEVKRLLATEFGLCPYVATSEQRVDDIMAITKELRASDYYLFIDFKRRKRRSYDLPCSLFTHQELALAHHLGFRDEVISLQQKGAPTEGFLDCMQLNSLEFDNITDLLEKLRKLVKAKGWNPHHSRNLVIGQLTKSDLFSYADHTGLCQYNIAWTAKIENKRPDAAAVGAVCILDTVNGDPSADRAYLKWADQASYQPTILPLDLGRVALFAVRPDRPGLFLQSLRDHTPREPIVCDNGDYDLAFKIFSHEFPFLQFIVAVNLRWHASAPNTWTSWETQTEAMLGT